MEHPGKRVELSLGSGPSADCIIEPTHHQENKQWA